MAHPRLKNKSDWVRQELEIALQNDKKIIPVLLDDALMPRADELPESMRGMVDWQAHRIRVDSRDSDIEELVSQVERGVAPTWSPSDVIEARSSRQPGRWLAVLTAALAVLLLAAPSVVALNAAPPIPGEVPAALRLALWSLLLMCAPFVAATLVAVFRSSIYSTERDLHGTSVNRYNKWVSTPLTVVVLASPLVIYFSLGNGLGILVWPLIASLVLVYAGREMIRSEKNEDERRSNWPYRLPTLPHPVVLRQGVTVLGNQLKEKEWARPLSKERRERATWMLDALDEGAKKMRKAAQRGRWYWLIDRPWWVTAYTLWVAITVGLVMATVVPLLRAGRTSWHVYSLPVFALLVSGALSWGIMDVVYRRHRWHGRAVAAEVTENVRKLRRQLDDLVAPPAWDLIDLSPAHHVDRGQTPG